MKDSKKTGKAIAKREDWERSLIDDCTAIVTEGVFHSRWSLIETYHQLGARILEDWASSRGRPSTARR